MCIVIIYVLKDYYFGRNFDYEIFYNEVVIIMLRNYKFLFWEVGNLDYYFVIIGIVVGIVDYLFYYDVINEKGLGMVGLNFLGYVDYKKIEEGKENVFLFEFIFWVLG